MTVLDCLIIAYGVPELTLQAMKHLVADSIFSQVQLRMMIWDNAATTSDTSAELQPHLARIGGRYIASENIGVYPALNRALAEINADTVLIASSDAAAFAGCLSWVKAAHEQYPEVAWLGLTPADDFPLYRDLQAARGGDNPVQLGLFEAHLCLLDWKTLKEKVGLFDERFFFTFGDTDYVERMRKAEVKFGKIARPLCAHIGQASRAAIDVERNVILEGMDREAFYDKWRHDPDVMARHGLPPELRWEDFLDSGRMRRSARAFL